MASVLPFQNGYRGYVSVTGFRRKTKYFPTQAEAQAWAAETERELKPKTTAYKGGKEGWTLRRAYAKFQELDQTLKRPRTIRREKQVATAVLKRLGDYALINIDVPLIQDYLSERY
ncbi:MAG: hypothetical protein NT083_12340, partial [Rhodocyclales bacterium]|nr:hypothetical protein [Rhodocyclales bacterium]